MRVLISTISPSYLLSAERGVAPGLTASPPPRAIQAIMPPPRSESTQSAVLGALGCCAPFSAAFPMDLRVEVLHTFFSKRVSI